MNYPELLLYWIRERYAIFQKKEAGPPAPWSADPVFQTTYFCNVHRENDRVTRWVRRTYSPWVAHPLFEYNMVLARFLNRPDTLEAVGFVEDHHTAGAVIDKLRDRAYCGYTVWGNAYVITTHGQKMDKVVYLAQVLDAVHGRIETIRGACRGSRYTSPPTCYTAAGALQLIPGIGSFLAGQVVADLKNTINHPLYSAPDRATFVVPGPGSLRGAGWYVNGDPKSITPTNFMAAMELVRGHVDSANLDMPYIDNQDLQNCLCEFDKYCRVRTGTGRSKRKYNAAGPYRG